MATAADARAAVAAPSLFARVRRDLAPFPGRAALTWRIALLCALVVGVAMLYQIPEAAISCYLVIFLMKPDAAQNVGTAVALIVLVSLVVAFVVLLVNLTVDSPPLRLITIAVVSFVFLFIGAATQLGEIGGVIALIIAYALALVNVVPVADAATLGLRYAWYLVTLPMAMMALFNIVLGISPVRLARATLRERLEASARAIAGGAPAADPDLEARLGEGNGEAEKRAGLIRLFHMVSSAAAGQLARDVRAGYRLMLTASGLPDDLDAGRRAALVGHIERMIAALDVGQAPPAPAPPPPEADRAERAVWEALAIIAGGPEGDVTPAPKPPFLRPDAFRNPDYQRFALKTTAAAIICYVVYTGLNWQGIHTALITCYVAALGTTGETVHKLGLRIVGCLIGATLGVASILFVVPHLESVGGLMVLIFAGILLAAWVSTGSERIAYGGVQIGLAFLLTVVQGFGPSLDLDTARDRIVGILLGNVVIYLIFTRVWVVSIERAAREHLAAALAGLARLAGLPPERRAGAIGDAAAAAEHLAQTRDMLELVAFEPASIRPSMKTVEALEAARAEISTLNRDIYLSPDDLSPFTARLGAIARAIAAPADGSTGDARARDETAQDALPAAIDQRLARLRLTVAGRA
ncbi:multidrug resistance protein MdtO [Angulomicrobium tetraedrale]|uniref:Multidrug resistance protein MdtO n=1 Tax=Ancylobacter tetraedralis TaxID=217068 RepID=A0A839ZFH5_9HYPH|nr:FUSC family protein [Ancylobacter tetraedralis]MBB3773514.1 multidrug resistance protein MdtO [Ancylobacter tetraedralis]